MGVKRWVESRVPLKSIRKDARTPEKPVKCHVPSLSRWHFKQSKVTYNIINIMAVHFTF